MSTIHWVEAQPRSARWHSESGLPLPRRVVVADDRMRAAVAYRLACEGTALLWRGDFQNARQLLRAMDRRVRGAAPGAAGTPAETFHLYRRFRAHRARVLGKVLVLLEEHHRLALRRAPDVSRACVEAYGPSDGPVAVALTELLGVISAREWRENGVHVPALDARIHPHYGVFAPTRSEYVDLVARTPLPGPGMRTAFDLGTGTGVLAAVLARRGVRQVVATDVSTRARACARDNVERLGVASAVRVTGPELYPDGRAGLVVCNPPWIPARPASGLDLGVYDAGGGMLRGFLDGLAGRLEPGGEGWLVLSDLAERLGLRDRGALLNAIDTAGLRVIDRLDTRPRHARVRDTSDPLHAVRAAEVTSLWRLAVA
ncbi:class I SAM-dependent methyltransferase [Streptomyces sp. NPDC006235]|uniref:class I SAM-dependent methyltransferase n=1 Tax=Streptomyces sp. NPDC006235 TaxID=3156736 RepID=UPI0033A3620B